MAEGIAVVTAPEITVQPPIKRLNEGVLDHPGIGMEETTVQTLDELDSRRELRVRRERWDGNAETASVGLSLRSKSIWLFATGWLEGFISPNDPKHRNYLEEQTAAFLFSGEIDKAEDYVPSED